MNKKPASKLMSSVRDRYKLKTLLSENDFTTSWEAESKKDGKTCFLKITNQKSSIEESILADALVNSFHLQKTIKSGLVLTARAIQRVNRLPIIEYPYLQSKDWQVLTPSSFVKRFPESFYEICSIIDYLHFLNLVHCDIKLENFLIHRTSGKIILTDLDSLRSADTPLKGIISGTPMHIAPEIFEDCPATAVSDNYSVGIMLKVLMQSAKIQGKASAINKMITSLCQKNHRNRPMVLLDELLRCKLITLKNFEVYSCRLLSSQLLSQFLSNIGKLQKEPETLARFFTDTSRIVGIPEELLQDLEVDLSDNRLACFQMIKSLINNANINRHDHYWEIDASPEVLIDIYKRINHRHLPLNSSPLPDETYSNLKTIYNNSEKLQRNGGKLKNLLLLYNTNQSLAHLKGHNEARGEVLQRLCFSLAGNGRTQNAIDIGKEALRISPKNIYLQREFILCLIKQCLLIGKTKDARKIIDTALKFRSNFEFSLKRLRTWTYQGETKGLKRLQDILEQHEDKLSAEEKVGYYNDIGAHYWLTGNLLKPRDNYLKAIKAGELLKDKFHTVNSMINLASIYNEMAQYKTAISLCKNAKKRAAALQDDSRLSSLYHVIAFSNARLGNYSKARYWLQEYRAYCNTTISKLSLYKILEAHLYLITGDLDNAEKTYDECNNIVSSIGAKRIRGEVLHKLAEIAFYRGNKYRYTEYFNRAESIFREMGNVNSLEELRLLRAFCNFYYQDEYDLNNFQDILESLNSHHCYYSYFLGILHLALSKKFEIFGIIPDEVLTRIKGFSKSSVPIFKSLNVIYNLYKNDSSDNEYLDELKILYQLLNEKGFIFIAAIVCRKISNRYKDKQQNRLALKYLEQSLKLLKQLSNKTLMTQLKKEVDDLKRSNSVTDERIDVFYKISDILSDVTDYHNAVLKILRFAINESGAERGALLLYSNDKESLHVKAFYNCDNKSLHDITALSKSISEMATINFDPLIVTDALKDERTKHFKSVIMYNILSVLCVPISYNQKVLGVLYLDHNTIPALFEKSDISFVSALTNFIGLMITLAQKFNIIQVTNDQLIQDLSSVGVQRSFVTKDEPMLRIFEKLPEIARSNASVLILGESGTGKEILCQMIHDYSLRSDKTLVKINCAALQSSLFESELFGVDKGVATGVQKRIGKFQLADGGTLLLDEIGDMPLEYQAKVLRVIDGQKFEMVGSNHTISTDVRLVFATNKNLRELIDDNNFREDLYYRINTIIIEISPLRERRGDIPLLIKYFARVFLGEDKNLNISQNALQCLLQYSWPGNVREVKNVVERLCILHGQRLIKRADLDASIVNTEKTDKDSVKISSDTEKAMIIEALQKYNWNQSKASKSIGMPLSTFRRRIIKYGITRN
ncbi:MAG: sigma 54-interacting transcriptional regulator [candidate division Zixibacteria bacterium]|nr:sigma 54-interacting transcriptional regulator [candidate division Zixibacteria bacterium]